MNQWYYAQNGAQLGPISIEDLQRKIQLGEIQPHQLVWRAGMPNWAPAGSVEELQRRVSESAPPSPTEGSADSTGNLYAAPASSFAPTPGPAYFQQGGGDYPIPVVKRTPFWPIIVSTVLMLAGFIGVVVAVLNSGGSPFELGLPHRSTGARDFAPTPMIITMAIAMLAGGVWWMVSVGIVVYRAWVLLQPGRATMSPGAATALVLIPCVSYVGNFFGLWKWTQDWNRITRQYGNLAGAPPQAEGLALGACIATVAGLIINCSGLVGLILMMSTVLGMCRSINFMADRREGIA